MAARGSSFSTKSASVKPSGKWSGTPGLSRSLVGRFLQSAGVMAKRRSTKSTSTKRPVKSTDGLAEEQQARLASIVESSEDAILSKDLQGIVRTWNPAAQRLFGYSEWEIIGRPITILIPPNRRQEEKMILVRIRRGEKVRHYETVRVAKNGRLVDVSMTVSPIRDSAGRIIGASTIVRDVTEAKSAAVALGLNEERLRLIFHHAPVGLEQVAINDGRLLEVNDTLCRMLGYSRQQLLKKNFSEITDPGDIRAERQLLRRMLDGEIPSYTCEKRYIRRDGSRIWVRVTSARAAIYDGRPYRISVIQDISEQKRADAAQYESAQRMRAIVETAVDAIITIDERGNIESVNPAGERLFGYAAPELIGRNVKMLMPEPYQSQHDTYLQNYLRTGKRKIIGIGREVVGLRKDATTFPMSLSVSEVELGDRRLFTGIVHDLTGRRQLEQEVLDISTIEQRRIGQDLHDGLCQDLIGIAFQVDFAGQRLASREAPEADVLNKLAGEIREAAGQARRLSHGLNPIDVKSGGLQAALRAMAEKISNSFHVDCQFRGDPGADVHNEMTATHLYRIAQEAIGNSIRHGKARRIEIEMINGTGSLTLSVKDDGIGFPGSGVQAATVPPSTGASRSSAPGIGLHTMHYRASLIGGQLAIHPGRRKGTIISCSIRNEALNVSSPNSHREPHSLRREDRSRHMALP